MASRMLEVEQTLKWSETAYSKPSSFWLRMTGCWRTCQVAESIVGVPGIKIAGSCLVVADDLDDCILLVQDVPVRDSMP